MRRRRTLVLRRDDHSRDGLGAVFLGVVSDPAEIETLVRRYLPSALHIVEIEPHDRALRIAVEHTPFVEEARNLVRLGRRLASSARPRSALEMIVEALRLDPLNVEALRLEARLREQAGEGQRAEECWIRAGEAGGFDAEMLRGLARAALEAGRHAAGIRYLQEAVTADPENGECRTLLDQLLRQSELGFEVGTDGRKGSGEG